MAMSAIDARTMLSKDIANFYKDGHVDIVVAEGRPQALELDGAPIQPMAVVCAFCVGLGLSKPGALLPTDVDLVDFERALAVVREIDEARLS
jgi:hypothetical protein